MNKFGLIAYAQNFVSFLLKSEIKETDIKEIILFGSVARGEADKKSDIDIFIDIGNVEKEKIIQKIVDQKTKEFYNSKIAEIWRHKGIENEISCKIGKLEDWKLKRSIISDGITLYGKYKELPKNLNHYYLFSFKPIKNITKRNRIIRNLFGRKEKNIKIAGILNQANGKKISTTSFIIPVQYSDEIIKLFGKEKINYEIYELWSDLI